MKLAICTPTTGNVRIEFVDSLLRSTAMLRKNKEVKDWCFQYYCSSVIPDNRHRMINSALNWGATHILFIDDDMRWPPEALKVLLKNKHLPIIGANCIKRKLPIEYMATGFDEKEVVSLDKTGFEEVLYTGNSFVMIQAEVFKKIPPPWFSFPYVVETGSYATEDFYFFRKALEHGYACIINHDISQLINHIGIREFTPFDRFG